MKKGKPFGVFAEILTSYLSRLGLSWERKPPKMPPIKFQKIISSGLTLADLRHTAGTLLSTRATIKQVQEFLGHEDISTTANIYVHLLDEDRKVTSEIMDAILREFVFCTKKSSESE